MTFANQLPELTQVARAAHRQPRGFTVDPPTMTMLLELPISVCGGQGAQHPVDGCGTAVARQLAGGHRAAELVLRAPMPTLSGRHWHHPHRPTCRRHETTLNTK